MVADTFDIFLMRITDFRFFRKVAILCVTPLPMWLQKGIMVKEPTEDKNYSLQPYCGDVPAARDLAIKRLLHAIIVQAGRDARSKNEGNSRLAQRWLLSEECAQYCEFSGVNFQAVKSWVENGCKELKMDHPANQQAGNQVKGS
jgi:hypothetical protein